MFRILLTILLILWPLTASAFFGSPLNRSNKEHPSVWTSKSGIEDNSATGVFSINVPTNGYCSVHVDYLAVTTDATDYQAHSGSINFALVRKVDAVSCDESLESSEALVVSGGTYTNDVWACTDGGTSPETTNFTINSSLDTASTLYYQAEILGTPGCLLNSL